MSTRQINTVAEWDTCPEAWMLVDALFRSRHLRRVYPKSQRRRKLRLYCCGALRECWNVMEAADREAVEVGERFADNVDFRAKATRASGRNRLYDPHPLPDFAPPDSSRDENQRRWIISLCNWSLCPNGLLQAAVHQALWGMPAAACGSWQREEPGRRRRHWHECLKNHRLRAADLVREVFRCPFLPPESPPATSDDIRRWARSIYDERRFDELPVLGDAVEEAGCDDERLLDHLRGVTTHVRGCWALDRLLGFV